MHSFYQWVRTPYELHSCLGKKCFRGSGLDLCKQYMLVQATEAMQKNALELLRPTTVRRNSSNECALTSFDNICPLPVIKPEADPTPPTVLTLASNPEQLTYSIVCCRQQRKICRKGCKCTRADIPCFFLRLSLYALSKHVNTCCRIQDSDSNTFSIIFATLGHHFRVILGP